MDTNISELIKEHNSGNERASYLLARLILDGYLKFKDKDNEVMGLSILHNLAEKGYAQARTTLNEYCVKRYEIQVGNQQVKKDKPGLYDFGGNLIKIDRTGPLTPVDVTLDVVNGRNVLNISLNIEAVYFDDMGLSADVFEEAVYDGVMEWEGDYTVFGGQQLSVRIHISAENRRFDKVRVFPVTDFWYKTFGRAAGFNSNAEKLYKDVDAKRSFAFMGIRKWSAYSRKTIFICSEKNFTDYDEIKDVTKHEFGHVLGLGDLYYSRSDDYEGVEKGTFQELDSYFISNKIYNLVMCNHHGPVSNNDIEMVVLAFRENKMQAYQKCGISKKISKALGKGN